MKEPATIGNGKATAEPMVRLGALGLPRYLVSRVHRFRRELEQAVSEAFAGAVPLAAREKVRGAAYAYAAILRGHTTLQQATKGTIALTFAEREEVEQRIGRASDRLDRALTALGLPVRPPAPEEQAASQVNALIQQFGAGTIPTPPTAHQRTNGRQTDPMPTPMPTTRQSGFNAIRPAAEPTAPDIQSDALDPQGTEKDGGKEHYAEQSETPDNRERLSTVQTGPRPETP